MVHYDESIEDVCANDHAATRELQAEVVESLQYRFPTVGSLIERGFVPYFDFAAADDDGWSHWLNPEFIDDDTVVDPTRPESVLVDHKWWRPIGVMFIATRHGDPVDPPPTVYENEDGACVPWHAHVGAPGRYSWWKFRKLYADRRETDELVPAFPDRTPWMMHMWAYPHPESVYAHGAPPLENRGGPPAAPAGFDTDAEPGEDPLRPSVLPDGFRTQVDSLP